MFAPNLRTPPWFASSPLLGPDQHKTYRYKARSCIFNQTSVRKRSRRSSLPTVGQREGLRTFTGAKEMQNKSLRPRDAGGTWGQRGQDTPCTLDALTIFSHDHRTYPYHIRANAWCYVI